jgi:hypothetical protein
MKYQSWGGAEGVRMERCAAGTDDDGESLSDANSDNNVITSLHTYQEG